MKTLVEASADMRPSAVVIGGERTQRLTFDPDITQVLPL
jgi:hypothetical protein